MLDFFLDFSAQENYIAYEIRISASIGGGNGIAVMFFSCNRDSESSLTEGCIRMKFGKQMVLAGVLMVALFGANVATAGNPIEKLGRGVANVAFGPLELLMKPYDVANEKGNIAGLTYGVFKGVAYTIAREVVGVVDIVTFPVPLPGCTDDPLDAGWGYGPIMRPAWVVDVEHNAYNFFYNDQAIIDAQ